MDKDALFDESSFIRRCIWNTKIVLKCNTRFLQAQNSLYGFNNAKQMVQYVRLVYGETNFIRSEYNHCVYGIFIILVLYVMLVVSTSMVEINRLAQLVRTFVMKDLEAAK